MPSARVLAHCFNRAFGAAVYELFKVGVATRVHVCHGACPLDDAFVQHGDVAAAGVAVAVRASTRGIFSSSTNRANLR